MIKYWSYFIVFCCVPKVESADEDCQSNKRQKTLHDVLNEGRNNSSYHPTMGHVVAICHARIPFIQIREEVNTVQWIQGALILCHLSGNLSFNLKAKHEQVAAMVLVRTQYHWDSANVPY